MPSIYINESDASGQDQLFISNIYSGKILGEIMRLQDKIVNITQNGTQEVTYDSNYAGLNKVTINTNVPNPSTGTINITTNGTYDVTEKASAVVNVVSGKLPSAYQEVTYIKADAGQYIDLGFVPNKYNSYRYKCSVNTVGSQCCFAGTYTAGNSSSLSLCMQKDNQWGHGIFLEQYYTGYITFPQTEETVYDIYFNVCGKCFVNGTEYSLSGSYLSVNLTVNLFLFAQNLNGSPESADGTRTLYGAFQVFEKANNLIHNYVPCYRKSDNEIGLYDTVTDTFFTNQGTGTFLKGADVN